VRVLIVDDHALFAEAVQAALVDQGLDVTVAHDGEAALTRSNALDPPDLVLMDVGLPGETGLEVGRKILERRPETQVVALTALHDPAVADEALRSGFSGYLTKETKLSRLMNAIRVIVDGGVVVQDEFVSTRVRKLPCDVVGPADLPRARSTRAPLRRTCLRRHRGGPPHLSEYGPNACPGHPRKARRPLSSRGRGIRIEARPVRSAEGRRTNSPFRVGPHPNVVAAPTSVGACLCIPPRLRSRPIRNPSERRWPIHL
jgi:DNA-binding NarL/FixJ family response regulator